MAGDLGAGSGQFLLAHRTDGPPLRDLVGIPTQQPGGHPVAVAFDAPGPAQGRGLHGRLVHQRRVAVDACQRHRPTAGRSCKLPRCRQRPVPAMRVPPVAPDHSARVVLGVQGHGLQQLGAGAHCPQVQPQQGQPGRGEVDVTVDERGSDRAAGEVEVFFVGRGLGWVVAHPCDPTATNQHRPGAIATSAKRHDAVGRDQATGRHPGSGLGSLRSHRHNHRRQGRRNANGCVHRAQPFQEVEPVGRCASRVRCQRDWRTGNPWHDAHGHGTATPRGTLPVSSLCNDDSRHPNHGVSQQIMVFPGPVEPSRVRPARANRPASVLVTPRQPRSWPSAWPLPRTGRCPGPADAMTRCRHGTPRSQQ